jgi:hypothetical protein
MLPKAKKIVLYGLAVVGCLAIAWLFGGFGINLTQRISNDYGSGYGIGAAPAPTSLSGGPNFDLLNPFAAKESAPSAVAPSVNTQTVSEGELTKRKVVRNGSLALLVNKAEDVAQSIHSIAEAAGGFVQDSQVYEVSAGVKSGTVVIRVPADKFSEAMDAIKKLAVKVESESTNAQDVTEQFIDYEAQLRNLRAQEEQLLTVMKSAKTVEDTLQVVAQLNSVRGTIERIQGQLQYLSRQVDMSSITVTLTAEADVQVFGIRWRPLFVVKEALRNLLSGLTGYVDGMIYFLFNLPIYLLWIATIGVIGFGAWKAILWVRQRFLSS